MQLHLLPMPVAFLNGWLWKRFIMGTVDRKPETPTRNRTRDAWMLGRDTSQCASEESLANNYGPSPMQTVFKHDLRCGNQTTFIGTITIVIHSTLFILVSTPPPLIRQTPAYQNETNWKEVLVYWTKNWSLFRFNICYNSILNSLVSQKICTSCLTIVVVKRGF